MTAFQQGDNSVQKRLKPFIRFTVAMQRSPQLITYILLICVIFSGFPPASAGRYQCSDLRPDLTRWSQWAKRPMQNNDDVLIDTNEAILLDHIVDSQNRSLVLGEIRIRGILVIENIPSPLEIRVTQIIIESGGHLIAGDGLPGCRLEVDPSTLFWLLFSITSWRFFIGQIIIIIHCTACLHHIFRCSRPPGRDSVVLLLSIHIHKVDSRLHLATSRHYYSR